MQTSIIIASYNYELFISATLDSLIAQTCTDWEAIVVDDGSSDNSLAIIREYAARDPRIKLFTHEGNANKGLTETLKLAVTHCSGEWIAFCESDDWWAPQCLEKRFRATDCHPKAQFVFNQTILVEETGKTSYKVKGKIAKKFRQCALSDMREFFPDSNPVVTFSCAMVKKSLLEQCNFDSPIPVFLDCWLWSQIAFMAPFLLVDEELTYWRQHSVSYTQREQSGEGRQKEQLMNALRKHLKKFLIARHPEQTYRLTWLLGIRPVIQAYTANVYQRKIDARYERIFFLGMRIAKIPRSK